VTAGAASTLVPSKISSPYPPNIINTKLPRLYLGPLTASFTYYCQGLPPGLPAYEIYSGKIVQFTDTSTGTYAHSCMWDFDDGTTSSESNPQHIFYDSNPCDFRKEVTLTVTDTQGTTSKAMVVLLIFDPPA